MVQGNHPVPGRKMRPISAPRRVRLNGVTTYSWPWIDVARANDTSMAEDFIVTYNHRSFRTERRLNQAGKRPEPFTFTLLDEFEIR